MKYYSVAGFARRQGEILRLHAYVRYLHDIARHYSRKSEVSVDIRACRNFAAVFGFYGSSNDRVAGIVEHSAADGRRDILVGTHGLCANEDRQKERKVN